MNDLDTLLAMGFAREDAETALSMTQNLEQAANLLLSGGIHQNRHTPTGAQPTAGTASPQISSEDQLILGALSQYSVPDGRSACTCFALEAASLYLGGKTLDDNFLKDMIEQGITKYTSAPGQVEHLSAEEVLQKGIFDLSLRGGIQQGILSHEYSHPMGMSTMLSSVSRPACILITKTPETVLVILEDTRSILVDSHPRPQLGADQAYARICTSLPSLIACLESIFPVTDLGPDIPELMATMYNSFDLYVLDRKT